MTRRSDVANRTRPHTCMCTWTLVPLSSRRGRTEVDFDHAHFLSGRGRGSLRFRVVVAPQNLWRRRFCQVMG